MNIIKTGIAIAIVVGAISGCDQSTSDLSRASDKPESELAMQSYALGHNMGGSLKAAGIEIDSAYFNAGFYDAAEGSQLMSQEEIQTALMNLQKATQEAQQAKMMAKLEDNLKASEANLAANAEQEGIVVTESGLQYKVITAGDGTMPTATDSVTVHYEGRLFDGTVFDSSIARGEPVTFPVGGVIPGWTEALQLMPVGSKWQLFIPSNLAYGESGAGGQIEPNMALVFDVELLAIAEDEEATAAE